MALHSLKPHTKEIENSCVFSLISKEFFKQRIFLELALHLQGRRFQSTDEVKSASQAELKDMAKNGFRKCFDEFYKRSQKCTVVQESYFEEGCVSAT
ncbi:hypothetical protein TNCV_3377721 [Trichonephila clavipes]|nr:hypothetical protein TNCV_3377721 [Trichonephila clavipes]